MEEVVNDAPRRPGRPPGSQNKVGKSEKEFIESLLSDTQDQYRKAFMALANSERPLDQKRFLDIRKEMSKMIVPRPTEISLANKSNELDAITVMFNTWNDDADEDTDNNDTDI